MIINY